MAEPVLLISSDSFLGPSLEAVARGRLRVARLDPSLRPVAWPAEPAATVILDVTARQRDAFHTWVRRYHPGPMVVVLKPGEHRPTLPRDPDLVVVARPFRLVDLVTILEHPPAPPGPGAPAPDPGPGPRRSRRGVAVRVLVGLLVLLALAAALFAFGLLGGRRDFQDLLVSGALHLHG